MLNITINEQFVSRMGAGSVDSTAIFDSLLSFITKRSNKGLNVINDITDAIITGDVNALIAKYSNDYSIRIPDANGESYHVVTIGDIAETLRGDTDIVRLADGTEYSIAEVCSAVIASAQNAQALVIIAEAAVNNKDNAANYLTEVQSRCTALLGGIPTETYALFSQVANMVRQGSVDIATMTQIINSYLNLTEQPPDVAEVVADPKFAGVTGVSMWTAMAQAAGSGWDAAKTVMKTAVDKVGAWIGALVNKVKAPIQSLAGVVSGSHDAYRVGLSGYPGFAQGLRRYVPVSKIDADALAELAEIRETGQIRRFSFRFSTIFLRFAKYNGVESILFELYPRPLTQTEMSYVLGAPGSNALLIYPDGTETDTDYAKVVPSINPNASGYGNNIGQIYEAIVRRADEDAVPLTEDSYKNEWCWSSKSDSVFAQSLMAGLSLAALELCFLCVSNFDEVNSITSVNLSHSLLLTALITTNANIAVLPRWNQLTDSVVNALVLCRLANMHENALYLTPGTGLGTNFVASLCAATATAGAYVPYSDISDYGSAMFHPISDAALAAIGFAGVASIVVVTTVVTVAVVIMLCTKKLAKANLQMAAAARNLTDLFATEPSTKAGKERIKEGWKALRPYRRRVTILQAITSSVSIGAVAETARTAAQTALSDNVMSTFNRIAGIDSPSFVMGDEDVTTTTLSQLLAEIKNLISAMPNPDNSNSI